MLLIVRPCGQGFYVIASSSRIPPLELNTSQLLSNKMFEQIEPSGQKCIEKQIHPILYFFLHFCSIAEYGRAFANFYYVFGFDTTLYTSFNFVFIRALVCMNCVSTDNI